MTSTSTPRSSDRRKGPHLSTGAADKPASSAPLRLVLLANAVTSAGAGLVAALTPGWVAERLGLAGEGATNWTHAVGWGLVVFAAVVALAAMRFPESTRRSAVAISAVDLAWIAATVIVIATAELSPLGITIALVMGVGVAVFASLQLYLAGSNAG